ncbi:MAG: hypothetical protein AAF892_16840 [Cyanobacteria bacterium P01_D01_bin.71]
MSHHERDRSRPHPLRFAQAAIRNLILRANIFSNSLPQAHGYRIVVGHLKIWGKFQVVLKK